MAEVNKSKRDKLRSLTVGGNKTFSKHIVEYGGEQFEFRTPTVGTFRRIRNLATLDGEADEAAIVIWGIIYFCYVPGTDERVFDDVDFDNFMNSPLNGFFGVLREGFDMIAAEYNESRADKKND